MKWSFSSHKAFRRCQRQWFFKNILANSIAKDPQRREAHRLSRLVTVWSWRGRVVDSILSNAVIPQLARGRGISLDAALQQARNAFDQEKPHESNPDREYNETPVRFVEMEHGLGLPASTLTKAWADIEASIRSFYANKVLIESIARAQYVCTQRPLSFNHDDATVSAVPDVICFYANEPPFIIDWKVNTAPIHDFWLQLAIYAIALTRCNSHKDWPVPHAGLEPTTMKLAEVQLLTDAVRTHTVTDDDVDEITELIYWSFNEMMLACGGKPNAKGLRAQDFLTAFNPSSCRICAFQKLCCAGGEP